MKLGTPRSEQGQILQHSYGWGDDGHYYRRTLDTSNGEVYWSRAKNPNDVPDDYEAGGADFPPKIRWMGCFPPKGEK